MKTNTRHALGLSLLIFGNVVFAIASAIFLYFGFQVVVFWDDLVTLHEIKLSLLFFAVTMFGFITSRIGARIHEHESR